MPSGTDSEPANLTNVPGSANLGAAARAELNGFQYYLLGIRQIEKQEQISWRLLVLPRKFDLIRNDIMSKLSRPTSRPRRQSN